MECGSTYFPHFRTTNISPSCYQLFPCVLSWQRSGPCTIYISLNQSFNILSETAVNICNTHFMKYSFLSLVLFAAFPELGVLEQRLWTFRLNALPDCFITCFCVFFWNGCISFYPMRRTPHSLSLHRPRAFLYRVLHASSMSVLVPSLSQNTVTIPNFEKDIIQHSLSILFYHLSIWAVCLHFLCKLIKY